MSWRSILCSSGVWNRKQKDTMSSKDKELLAEKFENLAEEWTRGVKTRGVNKGKPVFQNAKDAGYNNWETFEWIYTTYTKDLKLDPDFQPLNFKKFRKFELGLNLYNKQLAQKRTAFARQFHLPRATLRNLPELAKFEKNLHREQSYYRDYNISSTRSVNSILSNMKEIAGEEGGMLKSLLIKGSIIGDGSSELKKINSDYTNLWQRFRLTNDVGEKQRIYASMNENRNEVKQLYQGGALKSQGLIQQVLQGVDPSSIPSKRQDPINGITRKQRQKLEQVQDSMQEIRRNTVTTIIKGLQKIKSEAKRKNMPWVDGVVDRINGYIKAIEFQEVIDRHGVQISQKQFLSESLFRDLNFSGKSLRVTPDKKVAFTKHYNTQYTIEIMKNIRDLQESVELSKNALDQNLKADLDFWDTNIINIAKPRSLLTNNHYQTDPYFMLQKYTSDAGIFNLKTHLKANFGEAFRALTTEHLEPAKRAGRKDLEEATMDMRELLKDTYKEVDLVEPSKDPGFDNMMRTMTSLTYFRLMGGNIRSAGRNGTQRFYELSNFGFNAVRQAYKFYRSENSDQRREMVDRQKTKFGLQWFDGKTLVSKLIGAFKSGDEKLSEQSRGALEDAHRLDSDLYIDKNGELTINRTDGVSANIAKVAGKAATTFGTLHRVVEDWNRGQTFRTAFALAYSNLRNNSPRPWVAKQVLGKNKIEKLKSKYGEDYDVGYKDLVDLYGEGARREMDIWAEHKAGQIAYNSVLDLHFEYAKWNKAKMVKGANDDNRAAKMAKIGIGQFAHYRFNMIDMMHGFARDAGRSIRAGDFMSEEVLKPIRMGMVSALVTGASLYTKTDFIGLYSNDVVDMASAFWTWMSSNREKLLEGEMSEETADKLRRKTYGQGGLYFLGPNVGQMVSLVELYTKSQGIKNPLANEAFEGALEETMNKAQLENRAFYNKLAVINAQIARTAAYGPNVWSRGGLIPWVQLELGLFPSKEQREWRNYLSGSPKKKSRKKIFKKTMPDIEYENIMKALGNL